MPAMKTVMARTISFRSTSTTPALWPTSLFLGFLVFLWAEVFKHLSNEWTFNPQYSYGWAVPFLAIFLLLWQRWPERPSSRSAPKSRAFPIATTVVFSFLLLPIRFLSEANPDWRLLSWGLAFIALTISLCLIYLIGGAPWLRHFAFPFCFVLVAVPWPVRFEQFVIQGLMRAVTAINVAGLNAAGIPALQHGNVIEVTSGLIGIEEACSGVRSLQATLMISLFLGELYSFTMYRRLFLLLAGGILAFISNVVRTAILVWIGANRGTDALENWHDPAGLTILLICLFGLWFLSLFMRRHENRKIMARRLDSSNDIFQITQRFRRQLPLLAALTLWLVLSEIGAQFWYGLHRVPPHSRWAVSWPKSEADFKSVPISPEAARMLRYDDGGGAGWTSPDGHHWLMYFFHWLPGRTAALFVKIHRPEKCLPASGLTMIRDSGFWLANINGADLPLRSYLFDDHGVPLHVFYCYWDARSSYRNVAAAEQEDWTAWGRIRAALHGRREVGAQMLEIAVWGCADDSDARKQVVQQLKQIIHSGEA